MTTKQFTKLHKYPWCTTLSYSQGYFCSFFIELNTLASGTMTSGAQLSKSERQSDCESLSTSPGSPREILQGGTRLLLDPQRQAETSFKIEDLRFNKTTGKLS
jgi:hypothetical protein